MNARSSGSSIPPVLRDDALRRDKRAQLLAAIPSGYNPWLHLAGTTGVGVAVLAAGIWGVRDLRAVELLVVPLMFLIANGFEWRAHKDLLHKMRKPMEFLYLRHTPEHHVVYVEEDMAIRDPRELRLVLIPAWGVFGIVMTIAPLAAGIGWLTTANAGWLMLVTSGLYMVGYELSHLSYHVPATWWIGRLALVRVLRRHHARHHDPRMMQRWNFNVTIPLFDYLHGTVAPAPRGVITAEKPAREELAAAE